MAETQAAGVLSIRPPESDSTSFDTPDGTAEIVIDRGRGVMHISAAQEVTALDWAVVCGMLRQVGVTDPGEPSWLGGVDVWTISLRP